MKTAYPQIKGTCSIRLYSNIPFDNTYQHHSMISRLFSDDGDSIYTDPQDTKGLPKERFINRQRDTTGLPYYYPRYDLTGDFNFDFTNGLVGSVVLELTPEQTNANYLRLTCGNDIYYYFITGIQQINFETYRLSLELDVLMTYQDEFLQGIRGKPVMTDRKHCHRYDNSGIYPKCYDFKTGENLFAGVKPSIVERKIDLNLANNLGDIQNVMWLYMCVDTKWIYSQEGSTPSLKELEMWYLFRYKYKNSQYPLSMIVIPLGINSITLDDTDGEVQTISNDQMEYTIADLVGTGYIHACKISPYPPFNILKGQTVVTMDSSRNMTIRTNDITRDDNILEKTLVWSNEKTDLIHLSARGYFIITQEGKNNSYDDYELTPALLDVKNNSKPTIDSLRYKDPKLLFSPFKKYLLTSTYSSGNEFFPELIYSDGLYLSNEFKFRSIYNSYIGDYSIFTYQEQLTDEFDDDYYKNYKSNNIGLSATTNYIIPAGTNALDVFNATQAQSYYQSKTASGITSVLSTLGGVATMGVGIAMENPLVIAGGATAVASGVASFANTIKSTTAKIEDLKNTPDAINVQGVSVVGDLARHNLFPFISVYTCSDAVRMQANDFFYNYGYQVARDCYFNTDLYFEPDNNDIDDNLFGRRIFNYIKLNEDITNKIDYDMPLIAKQKLSKIFNNGITIWSFFGNQSLWYINDVTSAINPDKWFMKHTYDNSEW